MSIVLFLGALTGAGAVGLISNVRVTPPTLEAIAAEINRSVPNMQAATNRPGVGVWAGRVLNGWIEGSGWSSHPRWLAVQTSLSITAESIDTLGAKILVSGGVGLLGPFLIWIVADMIGVEISPVLTVLIALIAGPIGACLPAIGLFGRARARRRHFRVVIGSFVDLVVLGLAGGVGIEGALFSASQVSSDWAASRMAKALFRARDGGQTLWSGLAQLGAEIGVPELLELATTLELAGTEGARIRQSLSARAVALRRHEQADAESDANAMTERLFIPGSLLLLGFLLFIGYPALSRIIGGF
jgi:Flp pilus assembly protein TadB